MSAPEDLGFLRLSVNGLIRSTIATAQLVLLAVSIVAYVSYKTIEVGLDDPGTQLTLLVVDLVALLLAPAVPVARSRRLLPLLRGARVPLVTKVLLGMAAIV